MVDCLLLSAGIGLGSCLVLPWILLCIVNCFGYGRGGVEAGSCAAACMACGEGETPCYVSICQSWGAAGFSCCCRLLLGIIPGALVAYFCYQYSEDGTVCLTSLLSGNDTVSC